MPTQSRLGITDDMIGGFGSGGGGGSRGGGSATAAGAVEAAPVAAAPAKEKEIFDIKLTVFDAKSKIKIIKEVRAITALGLKEVSYNFFLPTFIISQWHIINTHPLSLN